MNTSKEKSSPGGGIERFALLGEGMRLRVLVVVCGAGLMVWEIAGSRVLGPDFGSTIYVWGSLIGVVLGALSLGYYLGGRIVDRIPSVGLLCSIIATAGIILLVDRFIAAHICRAFVSSPLGPRLQPLAASIVLFLPASILLGMVSPFAVRLEAKSVGTMGNVAGGLYALSTIGSIIGTLLTSFYLLETFAVSTIILILAGALIAAALYLWLPRVLSGTGKAAPAGAVMLSAVVLYIISVCIPVSMFSTPLALTGDDVEIVAEMDSPYQHIVVLDRDSFGRRQRDLIFDKYVQSSVYPNNNFEPASQYTELFYLPFVFNRDISDVLIVGVGGGTGPKMFHEYERMQIDSVEIDPKVVEAAKKYFDFNPDERMRIHVGDGRVFIRESSKKYDLIILDAYAVGCRIPFHLLTKEFYENVRAHLKDGGVVHSNIIAALEGKRSRLFRSCLKTFNAVFGSDNVYVFRKRSRWSSSADNLDTGNNAFIAVPDQNRRMRPEAITRAAQRLVATDFVPLPDVVFHSKQLVQKSVRLDDVPVLTDDYAPVDLMVAAQAQGD